MRPHKQGLSYFPHDTDAVNDDKIQSLMALHGTNGYAFYFILLEKVFQVENGRLIMDNDAIIAGYAKTIGVKIGVFKAILNTALDIGCFDKDIYEKEWTLVKAPKGEYFYISDHPVTMHNNSPRPGRGNIGLRLKGIEIHLPISPKLCISFMCPKTVDEIRIKVNKSTDFLRKIHGWIEGLKNNSI